MNYFTISDFFSGEALRKSLMDDPVNPVLLDHYFEDIDRRVGIILQVGFAKHDYLVPKIIENKPSRGLNKKLSS